MAALASVGHGADLPSQDGESPRAQGLVICAKTLEDLGPLWAPAFPSAEMLGSAASLFAPLPRWDGSEGPRARVVIGPGVFAIERHDLARLERSAERALDRRAQRVALLAAGGSLDVESTREVTGWSRKSRANMVRALGELDYSALLVADRVPAMVTLTYPGEWETVAGDGKQVKRHLQAFTARFAYAWRTKLVAVWKLEFQRRGAPHYHLLMVPPHGLARPGRGEGAGLPFRAWLSVVWAAIVAHPDPDERARHESAGTGVDFGEGLRASDPRRVAVYFTKHGAFRAKEYQHIVPELWRAPGKGPGRFWGYWGLERLTAAVEVSERQAVWAVRIARRHSRAQGVTREVDVWRTPGGRPTPATWDVQGLAGALLLDSVRPARRRKARRRVVRMSGGAGWVAVNDGAAYASQLARALEVCGASG